MLAGDLGLSPSGTITEFPPGTVNGTIHDKDVAAEVAQPDRADAYADAAAQPSTTTFTGDQARATFHAGVHTTAAAVRLGGGSFVGVDQNGPDQQVTQRLRPARRATFEVRVTNRGDASDRMEMLGTARSRKFRVTYLADGENVTGAVVAGTYRTGALAPGDSAGLVVRVTRTAVARPGDRRSFAVRADSSHSRQRDTVAAVVVR